MKEISTTTQKKSAADPAKRLRQAELLLSVSKKLALLDSLEEILEALMQMTAWELKAERASLFLNDSQTNELYSIVALGTAVVAVLLRHVPLLFET